MKDEDHIERWVERQMDKVDLRYMKGELSTEEYKKEMKRISYEADVYYSYLEKICLSC
jgi:uncharacterized membrane protein